MILGGKADGRTTPSRAQRGLRLQNWVEERQLSLALVLLSMVISAIVHAVNLSGAPMRTPLEGSNIAYAWAWLNRSELDLARLGQSPLAAASPSPGWLQIAGWTGLTGAFDRYDGAVFAGREAMVVAHLVAIPLLWMLAGRLGCTRAFAAAALAVFALSPLALQTSRSVAFANVATPWLLAAWVLALAPRRQSSAFAAAAGCFAIAVLTQPSYLILLPFLGWSMWGAAVPGRRRERLSLALLVLAAGGLGIFFLARAIGVSQSGSASMSIDSAISQANLAGEALLIPGAALGGLVIGLFRLDPIVAILAPLGALGALFRPALRPLAASFICWTILLATPLGQAASSIFAMVAIAALMIAGGAEGLWSAARRRDIGGQRWRVRSVALLAGLGLAVASAVPLWGIRLDGLLRGDVNRPMVRAQSWLEDNVDRDARLLVGAEIWVDLVRAGFAPGDISSSSTYLNAEWTAPTTSWREYDYVVARPPALGPEPTTSMARALENSEVVARFGDGDQAVSVARVLPDGVGAARTRERADLKERQAAGAELVQNPSLRMAAPVRDLIAAGQLDPRALVLLPRAATTGTLRIDSLPEVAGEVGNDRPRRQVLISGRDGAFLSTDEGEQLAKIFTEQDDKYRPSSVTPRAGSLLLTWGLDYPAGLFG